MNLCILYRKGYSDADEHDTASRIFKNNIFYSRMTVPKNSVVIGRYSVLPNYYELSSDLSHINCNLINSYNMHQFVANAGYIDYIKQYTFETFYETNFHLAPEGAYVVKGRTNSKKFAWNKLMFAADKSSAIKISQQLKIDSDIAEQGILFRKYIPLETFEYGIDGLPFTNEWRLFFYKKTLISSGYYWSISENSEELNNNKCPKNIIDFAYQNIVPVIGEYVNFYCLDIAIREDNKQPILVEINDGQMSGLSMNDPYVFYNNLLTVINQDIYE